MAIKLIANYSKRLGLPGYSSHQFEVSIRNGTTLRSNSRPSTYMWPSSGVRPCTVYAILPDA